MRLLELEITRCHTGIRGRLPLDGLVVLFGPNSGGKTTVLEAVGALLGSDGKVRKDPGLDRGSEEFALLGKVWFEFPGADLPDSSDATMLRDLLAGVYARNHRAWSFVNTADSKELAGWPLQDVKNYLVESLVAHGTAGSREDRQVLAEALLRQPLFQTDPFGGLLLVGTHDRLNRGAIDAAERIGAEGPSEGDELGRVAMSLRSEESWLAVVAESADEVLLELATVITLDADPERLNFEIERAIVDIHNHLWESVDKPWSSQDGKEIILGGKPAIVGSTREADEVAFPIDLPHPAEGNQFGMDSWLEAMVGDPPYLNAVEASFFPRYDEGEWYRVRKTVLATAQQIADEANLIAPSFLQELGEIMVEILPVGVWTSAGSRVRVTFDEFAGHAHDLKVVGSGTARWVAATVRLACHRLRATKRSFFDSDGQEVTDALACYELFEAARKEPLTQTALQLIHMSTIPVVYIVDEPEVHLHPLAVRSVVRWLRKCAGEAATVVVATHHPALLNTAGTATEIVLVTKNMDVINLERVQDSALHAVTMINDQVGLSPGELLLLSRLVVFVEGEHDRLILNEWFGNELDRAGIRIVPLRGVDSLVGIPESGLVQALRLPIAVLCDDTDVARARGGLPRTRGERAVTEFLRRAGQNDLHPTVVGLHRLDILDYLDAAICRNSAPDFPGWEEARLEARKAGYEDWKRWIWDQYLPLNVETIQSLARECREAERIPHEIVGKVRRLLEAAG